MNQTSTSSRHAALLLHAMPATDRQWLLAQLTPPERTPLVALLDELDALGMPADCAMLAKAIGTHAAPAKMEARIESPEQMRSALARVAPQRIVQMISAEPPALIAALLAIADWPWHQGVLVQLDPLTRQQVEDVLRQKSTCAPGLAEYIVVLLTQRLHDFPYQDTPAQQPESWRAVLCASLKSLRWRIAERAAMWRRQGRPL